MIELYAPERYWRLTEEIRAEITNGCGTRGLIGLLVPDTIWGLSIKAACNIHDWMYAVGETIEDKKEADRVFLNNMLRLIDNGWWWLKKPRIIRARTYYNAVKICGGPAFWSGKNKNANMG